MIYRSDVEFATPEAKARVGSLSAIKSTGIVKADAYTCLKEIVNKENANMLSHHELVATIPHSDKVKYQSTILRHYLVPHHFGCYVRCIVMF